MLLAFAAVWRGLYLCEIKLISTPPHPFSTSSTSSTSWLCATASASALSPVPRYGTYHATARTADRKTDCI